MPTSNTPPLNLPEYLQDFLQTQRLPATYIEVIDRYIRPIARDLANQHQKLARSLLIGVNGSQGSGKTTLSEALSLLLQHEHSLTAVAVSIDDFYLTRAEREQLARDVHPLLLTRGVPGTHDIPLAQRTLQDLTRDAGSVAVPRFDKAQDDRAPQSQWDHHQTPVDIVILEGWCVGASAQPMTELLEPVNDLEAQEDPEGNWRHYVNAQLQLEYQPLFQQLDCRIMLKAPSFDCVFRWRLEQEEKLRQKTSGSGLMSETQIQRFIQHYQRITEHTLKHLPAQSDYLLVLDENRQICEFHSASAPNADT